MKILCATLVAFLLNDAMSRADAFQLRMQSNYLDSLSGSNPIKPKPASSGSFNDATSNSQFSQQQNDGDMQQTPSSTPMAATTWEDYAASLARMSATETQDTGGTWSTTTTTSSTPPTIVSDSQEKINSDSRVSWASNDSDSVNVDQATARNDESALPRAQYENDILESSAEKAKENLVRNTKEEQEKTSFTVDYWSAYGAVNGGGGAPNRDVVEIPSVAAAATGTTESWWNYGERDGSSKTSQISDVSSVSEIGTVKDAVDDTIATQTTIKPDVEAEDRGVVDAATETKKDLETESDSMEKSTTQEKEWPVAKMFSNFMKDLAFMKEEEPTGPELDTEGMTERIMKSLPQESQATGAGGSSTWEAFLKAEENWAKLKEFTPFEYDSSILGEQNGIPPPFQFVTQDVAEGNPLCWEKLREQKDKKLDYDVVVCGGTLGIFFATALQLEGFDVCLVEAGKLRGREQEWNLSMEELMQLVKMQVLSEEDIDAVVKTEFPGCRSGFKNKEVSPLSGGYFDNRIGYECFTEDVLNLGISPSVLLDRVAQRFKLLGGEIKEQTPLSGVCVSESIGAAIDLGKDLEPITSRLVLDCMGNGSPISRQQRYGKKPDGICAVVGSCASGFDAETNLVGDIIYTNTEIQDKGKNGKMQYFWEAFPVGIGRNGLEPGTSDTKTTYMFTYMDAHPNRPSLETLMEDYWRLLPKYQPSITNPELDLDIKRVLFAYFPTYKESPLKPQWSRVLAVGDASGIQSPLSFGGFGALTRHLERINGAITEALDKNCLHKDDLAEINAYTPNLSASWMFQKAMSVRMGQPVSSKFVNRLLAVNFQVMDEMGKRTIKPFLQDVVRFDGLVGSLTRSFMTDPLFMPQIVAHVGVLTLAEWIGHVSMMGLYSVLDAGFSPLMKPFVNKMKDERGQFLWRRRMEAWKFGSGNDYELPKEN